MKIPWYQDVSMILMCDLALGYESGLIGLRQISVRHGISYPFLKKLVRNLKKAGLVTAKEGIGGGYSLSRSPRLISIWDIISANVIQDAEKNGNEMICPLTESCIPLKVRSTMVTALKSSFSTVTLSDIIKKSS